MKKTLSTILALFSLALISQQSVNLNPPVIIPVIIHVIHGGQSSGTYPNISQQQILSQVTVLNQDYSGNGSGVSAYPSNAFTTWATNTLVSANSKDGNGRIKISNTGISFCLVTQDSLGNTLAEPGIDRIDYNSITAALTGSYSSKNPASPAYNSSLKFMDFMDKYIKPATTWNCSKYMNIWITDVQSVVGLNAYSYFPPASTLPGIPTGMGTRTTDGIWCWSKAFGSNVLYPQGTYQLGYDLGRSATHETGHYLGLLHTYNCGLDDYCNDTPSASNSSTAAVCSTTYPYAPGSCTSPLSNSPDGEMFMNFMDRSAECAMYMFTEDQAARMQTALANSPYRKFLNSSPCSLATRIKQFSLESEISISPNPTNGVVTLYLPQPGDQKGGVQVYNSIGELLSVTPLESNEVRVDLTSLANGIYFVRIRTTTKRIIKQ